MLIQLLHQIKVCQNKVLDRLSLFLARRTEIKKFQDPRRVAIYSRVHLTSGQEKEIDSFYLKNYGSKIPHTWHKHYTAFTGKFDVNYFPELLYIPEFEYFMNSNVSYNKVFSDKNIISLLAKSGGIATPKVFLSRAAGLFRDEDNKPCSSVEFEQKLSNLSEAFIKPTLDTGSGKGCAVINMQNGKDTISGRTANQIINDLGTDFVVQERIKCYSSLSYLYPHSVNTFRIITYRWKDDILTMPIILRIGQGGRNLDNAHAGGMFVAVEDNGLLHDTAFTEFNQQYKTHPDTKISFAGYRIAQVPQLLQTAKQIHALLPQVGVYNWDFTINEQGLPALIEANTMGGGIWVIQMTHGKGPFGNNTAKVLQWLKLMKKLPLNKRSLYQYGQF